MFKDFYVYMNGYIDIEFLPVGYVADNVHKVY